MPEAEKAKLNIYQKVALLRDKVDVLQKNKRGYNYTYVTEDAILQKIRGLMSKLGVSLIPFIMPESVHVEPYHYTKTKTTKNGEIYEEHNNEFLVFGDMKYIWVNDEDPDDRIIVPWAFVGQQADAGQTFGTGLSYASRYFLLKYFNIPTIEDDPEAWRKRQHEADDAENLEIVKSVIDKVHAIVTTFVEAHPDRKDEVADVVKKYAKNKSGRPSGNYYDVKDQVAAGKLLEEVTVLFGNKSNPEAKEK